MQNTESIQVENETVASKDIQINSLEDRQKNDNNQKQKEEKFVQNRECEFQNQNQRKSKSFQQKLPNKLEFQNNISREESKNKQNSLAGSKELNLINEISTLQIQLEIQSQLLANKENWLQVIQNKILQLNQNIAILKQDQSQENSYILQEEEKLQKALKLKQLYQTLNSNSKSPFEKLIVQLKKSIKLFSNVQIQFPCSHQNLQQKINLIIKDIQKKKRANELKLKSQKRKNDSEKLKPLLQTQKLLKDVQALILKITSEIQAQFEYKQIQKTNFVDQQQITKFTQFEHNSKQDQNIQRLTNQMSQLTINPKKIDFVLLFKQKQIGKYSPTQSQTVEDLLVKSNLKFESKRLKIRLREQNSEEEREISSKDKILQVLGETKETKYECFIQFIIQITLDNGDKKQFRKGISLQEIKKKLRIRNNDCVFFSNYRQYLDEKAEIDLQLKQCAVCTVKYLNKPLKSVLIPIQITAEEALKYIPFENQKQQKLQTAYIGKIIAEGGTYIPYPKQLISQATEHNRIIQIIIEYLIDLKIQICSNNNPRDQEFKICAQKTIKELKEQFQKVCSIDRKLQRWMIGDKQIVNQDTFQALKIYQCATILQVYQIVNLQYYGFSSETPITETIFNCFYVQNDQQFLKQIQDSSFPDLQFEFSFRTKVLSKIFSCIKKHCRIRTALDSIKSIVSKSKKKRCKLWMPPSAKQSTYFNENYILFNILNSSPSQISIQICRTYKHHSCLPLNTRTLQGKQKDLKSIHYWISTKSMCVVSLQISKNIKGKSTFLNKIFNTDFDTEDKHPICQKCAYIKYDIYRNTNYIVDLIDVSSNSLSQMQKISLCRHANLLLIHLQDNKSQLQKAKKWLQLNQLMQIPVIYLFRDSLQMSKENEYQNLMKKNQQSQLNKYYYIPQLTKENVKFYEYQFCSISDSINKFIIQLQTNLTSEQKWNLTTYFQKNNSLLSSYSKKLKKLQKQFSTICNASKKQKGKQQFPKTLFELIQNSKEEEMPFFMEKMKQFARIQRTKNLSQFDPLRQIYNLLQMKMDKPIEQQKGQIQKCFSKLFSIEKQKTTQIFEEGLRKYKSSKQRLTYQQLELIYRKYLYNQYQFVIKNRQFSIQNFWRILLQTYSNAQQANQNLSFAQLRKKVIQSCDQIFSSQFQKGKTIELINGDTLQMPTKLLASHQNRFKGKNIMVIAIVGGQSSGKSTLLNFLFGCDFLSSQGRCTSGIYMTYYEVQGENIGCDGVLLLDTQGLFGNLQRKNQLGKNFDNKLVLFLIKTCDILIINNRGDVQKNIQDIFQLSFDCQLMKYEPGKRYPHLYIVLNIRTGSMNQQNRSEIIEMKKKIIESNRHMEKYFNSDESSSLPIAFSSKNAQGITTELNKIQSIDKTATKEFYQATRNLSLNLVKILRKRNENLRNTRNLTQIYEQMRETWSILLQLPILTKHMSKEMKKFDQQIQNFLIKLNEKLEAKCSKINSQIPNKLSEVEIWSDKILNEHNQFKTKIVDSFEKQFIGFTPQKDNLAKKMKYDVQNRLDAFFSHLKLSIGQKKYKIAIEESQNRGIDDLTKKARILRGRDLSKLEQQRQFDNIWNLYTEGTKKKIDRTANSEELYRNIQLYYNDSVKNNYGMDLSKIIFQNDTVEDFGKFYQIKKKYFFQKIRTINPLESVSISPVITLSKDVITDLKYYYFDMKTFFEQVQTKFGYRLTCKNLKPLINQNIIHQNMKSYIYQDQIITEFVERLSEDIDYFGYTISKQKIKEILIECFERLKRKQTLIYNIHSRIQLNQTEPKWRMKSIENFISQSKNPKLFRKFYFFQRNKIIDIQNQNKRFYHKIPIIDWGLNKTILKKVIQHYIINYAKNKMSGYSKSINEIESIICQQISDDLKKIGIIKKVTLQNINQALQFEPIQIKDKNQLIQKIQHLSKYFNIKIITQSISSSEIYKKRNHEKEQLLAFSITKKIQVKQQYRKIKIFELYKDKEYQILLQNIKNKQFLQFAKQKVKFQRLLIELKKQIDSISGDQNIQESINSVLIVLKNQLEELNRDLKQISHVVSLGFRHLLHQIAKYLIWKKLDIHKIKQNKKREQKLYEQGLKQKKFFLEILNNNSKSKCLSQARLFINAYRQKLQKENASKKSDFINQNVNNFLKLYTRSFLQNHIDSELCKTSDVDTIYQYLKYQKASIEKYYEQFVCQQLKNMEKTYICVSKASLNQFKQIIKQIVSNVKGFQQQWQVDVIFQEDYVKKNNQHKLSSKLREIFLQLLSTGKQINFNQNNNKFFLNSEIRFQITKKIQNNINISFIQSAPDIQIFNYSFFLQFLLQQLQNLQKQISKTEDLLDVDFNRFRDKTKLTICMKQCPCCDRLCDIDMKLDPHHTIHRIDSGHQPRAVKGMIIKKKVQNKDQFYASVIRCEDVLPDNIFQFYGKQYTWKSFKWEKAAEWNFQSKQVKKALFQHIWNICGKKICEEHQKQGKVMKFLDYSDGNIQFLSTISDDKAIEYIFAIDGSGSMHGDPWKTQLQQLKKILNDIVKNPNCTVSILVFNTNCYQFCRSQNPSTIDVNQIKFPNGSTNPEKTFIKAADIIKELCQQKQKVKPVYFFYISDGIAHHPKIGIQRILAQKKQLQKNNQTLSYCSILIGNSEDGKRYMQIINRDMGGTSIYIPNASLISEKIRQVLSK